MTKRGAPGTSKQPIPIAEAKSIGQLTSHIRNKQKREEAYGKLKHKKKVGLCRQMRACTPATAAGGVAPTPQPPAPRGTYIHAPNACDCATHVEPDASHCELTSRNHS